MRRFGTASGSRRLLAVALIVMPMATSVGCVSPNGATAGTKTAIGGLGGAVAGGIIGKAVEGHTRGAVAGALVGALLGGAIGNALDQRDRELAMSTAHQSLEHAPTGSVSTWENPDNGHSGSFSPTRTYQRQSGQYCREYQQEILVGGERQRAYGTACRQTDGSWQILN